MFIKHVFSVAVAIIVFSTTQTLCAGSLTALTTKQREEMQTKSNKFQDASYVYCDDKKIEEELKKARQQGDRHISVCTQNIDNNTTKKKFVTAIDSDKEIDINTMPQAGRDPRKIKLGTIDSTRKNIHGVEIKTDFNAKGIRVK